MTIPPDIESLADYERHAEAHMPPETWRHIQGGSGRETTIAENRAALDRLSLVPRMLTDLRGGSTAIDLLGRRHASPILLAPIAYQKLAHPEGEMATVRAAAALDTGMVVSTLSSVPIEQVAGAARAAAQELGRPPAPLWFQLYLQEDRRWSADLVRRAEAAGYEAIMLTVDASVKRSSFTLPADVDAANLRGMKRPSQTTRAGGSILFGTPLLDAAPRWDDLAWLRGLTKLPLLVKGLLAPEDVRMAIDHGVDGIVVSNHGGRVLDGLPSPLAMMPAIVEAAAGRVPLLLDGGIRSGTDIVKALAIGAKAVLIGRPQFHALAVAGLPGIAHAIHMLRADLEFTMAQIGCPTPADIGIDRLFGIGHAQPFGR